MKTEKAKNKGTESRTFSRVEPTLILRIIDLIKDFQSCSDILKNVQNLNKFFKRFLSNPRSDYYEPNL